MSERGGQATLLRGRWDRERDVVLKIYRQAQPRAGLWDLWRFAGEHDEHVIPLLASATDGLRDFEVMPYLPHGSLLTHVRALGRPLTLDESRVVLVEVTGALEYLHDRVSPAAGSVARAVVHGDIKPGNVLVRGIEPLRLCVTDFGVSAVHDFTREASDGAMTPAYAAPELFRRARSPAIDWWALGITLLELLQGFHPFQVGPDGPVLSDGEINEFVNNALVPIPDTVPDRWRALLRGLLTWAPESRWGARQVAEWLEGRDPAFDDHIGPVMQAERAFAFGGAEVVRPPQLAAAIAANWQAAGELVLGDGWPALLDWASSVPGDLRAALDEVDELFVQARSPVDRCICELMVRLDPTMEPRFRGFVADREGMVRLCVEAQAGDTAARAALEALLHSGALRALARLPGQDGLDLVAGQWERWHRMAEDHARDALGDLSRLPEGHRLADMLLRAVLDRVYQENLQRQARELTTRRARRTPWFRALTNTDPGAHRPPLDVVIVLVSALAEEVRRRPPTPQDEFAEAARGLRAEVDALVNSAVPAGGWIAAVPRLPVREQPVTESDRSRFGRAVVGTACVGVAIAVVAGGGASLATSVAAGGLVTLVLLVGTATLLAGLLRPRTPLAGALIGASIACGLGLFVAAGTGTIVGLVLGRELGVQLFWWAWALSVGLGAVVGAVRGRTREDVWWRVQT